MRVPRLVCIRVRGVHRARHSFSVGGGCNTRQHPQHYQPPPTADHRRPVTAHTTRTARTRTTLVNLAGAVDSDVCKQCKQLYEPNVRLANRRKQACQREMPLLVILAMLAL